MFAIATVVQRLCWVLSTGLVYVSAAEELRVISLDVGNDGRSGRATLHVHVGATLPEEVHAAIDASPEGTSTRSTVCVRVNGSSGGCFDGDSAHGALLSVDQEGVAWVSGHFQLADGRAIMSTPFAVRVPAADQRRNPSSEDDGLRDKRKEFISENMYHRSRHHHTIQEEKRRSRANRVNRDDLCDDPGAAQLNLSIGSAETPSEPSATISAVLLLTLDDANRARLLVKTLRACGALELFRDFFVVVREGELARIRDVLGTDGDSAVVMIDEDQLLSMLPPGYHNGTDAAAVFDDKVRAASYYQRPGETYALQMILKLLAASLMRTPYYLTLDADVLCTKSRLSERDLLPHAKGNYVPERRQVHPMWWTASAKALAVEYDPRGGGFGVTPAVLSTVGSMLALDRLQEMHGRNNFLPRMLNAFARGTEGWWSEYTLYRLALDHFGAFDALHAIGPTKLIGESVWFADDFDRWNATAVFNDDSAAFVVVQSTAGVDTKTLAERVSQVLSTRK